MKLRFGFVTNSSSTTHIMMWRGHKKDLAALLEAHRRHFNLSYEMYDGHTATVTSEQVSEAILAMMKKVIPAKKFAAETRAYADHVRGYDKECPDVNWGSRADAIENLARRADDFDWVLKVDFGDNHGDYEGGDLGNTMDYEGRFIRIVDAERGFYYATEQNR